MIGQCVKHYKEFFLDVRFDNIHPFVNIYGPVSLQCTVGSITDQFSDSGNMNSTQEILHLAVTGNVSTI
jgi:hypothetical protein